MNMIFERIKTGILGYFYTYGSRRMILIPIYAPFILIQLSIINIGNLNTLMPVYRTRHL